MTAASLAEGALGQPALRVAASPRRQRRKPSRAERRIVAALRRRDPRGLHLLYEEYGGTTFGFLVGTLRDHHTAQDVQQQVFLEAWQRSESYDADRAGLLTWLMTIARSRAIDHLRKRIPEPHDPSGTEGLAGRHGGEDRRLDDLVDTWQVSHLLQRLPSEESTLLRMRFYDDLSQREIAERTGIPLGTVKMRMAQALERLRTQVDREEVAA